MFPTPTELVLYLCKASFETRVRGVISTSHHTLRVLLRAPHRHGRSGFLLSGLFEPGDEGCTNPASSTASTSFRERE
jgi:hypothetical protein